MMFQILLCEIFVIK